MTDDGPRDRVFLVTGSGHGLGAALAEGAARAGAKVALNCRSNVKGAMTLAGELKKSGADVRAFRADVTEVGQVKGLVEDVQRAFGRIDVLVNTVGVFEWKPVGEMAPAEWREVMASNLDSVFLMCRQVLPIMREQHWGRIVNFGAVGAERTLAHPRVAAYCGAKSAVVAFSKGLALEEARCGITVNVVCPGVLEYDGAAPERAAALASNGRLGDRVPVGRGARPEDVIRAVLFFASPAADFVTGQVLAVSGGAQI